jgi:hypothetical protein
VKDAPADVNITNPRFEFLWQVGRFDLFDGMTVADQVCCDADGAVRTYLDCVTFRSACAPAMLCRMHAFLSIWQS